MRDITGKARLPFEPVRTWIGPLLTHVGGSERGSERDYGCNALIGEMMGVSTRTVNRWANEGVPARRADAVAISLGAHPLELWPDYHEVCA